MVGEMAHGSISMRGGGSREVGVPRDPAAVRSAPVDVPGVQVEDVPDGWTIKDLMDMMDD